MPEPEGTVPDSPGVRFPPPFVYVGLAAIAWWADTRWPLRTPAGPIGVAADAAGALLLLAGAGLDLFALAHFLRARTSALPFRPASRFVARGPCRWTRNPMYLGMTSLVCGFALTTERLLLLPAALLAAWVVDRAVIPREEAYLERRFGAGYLEYRSRVRRWL